MNSDDRNFDPMIYDVMRELATQLSGIYLSWEEGSKTEREAAHWQAERFTVMREVRQIDPDSLSAIEAKTEELRKVLSQIPTRPPAIA